jgi:hypothetical protein
MGGHPDLYNHLLSVNMRSLLIPIVISVLFESVSLCFADSGFTWYFRGSPGPGTNYTFVVRAGERDRWDSSSRKSPPLPPGTALRLAREFVQKVAPKSKESVHFAIPGGRTLIGPVVWEVYDVRLDPFVDSAGHEHWIYVIHFVSAISGTGRSGPPDMEVPVRMDGTIPEPVISTTDPLGAASGSQPSRSETNTTSSAAGSRRSP